MQCMCKIVISSCGLFPMQFVIDMRVLEHLERFIAMRKSCLDEEVFCLLSNILSGTPQQIQVMCILVYLLLYCVVTLCVWWPFESNEVFVLYAHRTCVC